MSSCGLKKFFGRFYSWNNKQLGDRRVFSKIDRVLCNDVWDDQFPGMEAIFLPKGTFDHSPMVVQFLPPRLKTCLFRF